MATTAELGSQSYWKDSASVSRYPALDRNLTVDVVVIGAGITGLTAAYLLKRSGHKVAVIDRRRCGGVDSGMTTAHLTCVTDASLSDLVKHFGRDHAQAAWDAGLAAIAQIDRIVTREDLDCEWSWVSGYKYAATLTRPRRCARRRGWPPIWDSTRDSWTPCRSPARPAWSMADRRSSIHGNISPRSPSSSTAAARTLRAYRIGRGQRRSPLRVTANGHTLTCGFIVIATHTPLMGKTSMASAIALQTKLYLYTSYVLGGRLAEGAVPEALFWDTADPYHYLRIDPHRGFDYAIFGGQDHKTGQATTPTSATRAGEDARARCCRTFDSRTLVGPGHRN